MATTTNLDSLVINYLTQEQYDAAAEAGTLNANQLYLTPDAGGPTGTLSSIGVSNATNGGLTISGSPLTSDGTITIGHSNVLSSAQTTQAVYPIKIDKNGHISEYGSAVSVPTKVSDLTNDSGFITNAGVTSITTTAGAHTAISNQTGAVSFNVPTKTSDLTNDSGFITSDSDEKVKRTIYTSSNALYPILHTDKTGTSAAYTADISFYQYYNTSGGYRRLDLGNATAWKSSGGAYGTIRLYGAAATYYGDLVPGVLGTTSGDGHISANRTWTLPDKTGTIALTSDLSDTKVTNTATTDATTLYLTGSTSNTTETGTLSKHSTAKIVLSESDTDTDGATQLWLGNNKMTGATAGAKRGQIYLYGTTNYYTLLQTTATGNHTINFPNDFGTVALTKNIPTNISAFTNDSGFITISDISGKLDVVKNTPNVGTHGINYDTNPVYSNASDGLIIYSYNEEDKSYAQFDQYLIAFRQFPDSSSDNNPNIFQMSDEGIYIHSTDADEFKSLELSFSTGGSSNTSQIILDSGGTHIYNVVTPTANTDAVNKQYVDAAIPQVYSSTNTSGYLTMATLPIYDGTVV